MQKEISPKIIAISFGVLMVCFAAAFYAIAWQEPSQTPPEGNISTPLNISATGQTKEGDLTINGILKTLKDMIISVVTIKGNGSVSDNLNSDRVDDYHAADLMAQAGGGATMVTWGGQQMGSCTSAGCVTMNIAPGVNAPACPSGWTEAYAGYGPTFFPGSTYYTAGNAICVISWRNLVLYLGYVCFPNCNQYGCTNIYCNTCRVCVK